MKKNSPNFSGVLTSENTRKLIALFFIVFTTIATAQDFSAKSNPQANVSSEYNILGNVTSDAVTLNSNTNQNNRQSGKEMHRFWLDLTSTSGALAQMLMGYVEGATLGVDRGIDGKCLSDGEVGLCSLIDGVKYVIQGRGLPFNATDAVALSCKITYAGNYTIVIDHMDGIFALGQKIYMKDNLTNTLNEINSSGYNFYSEPGNFNTRFEIAYENSLANDQQTFDKNEVLVYKQNHNLVINTAKSIMVGIKIFDIQGRLLVEEIAVNSTEMALPFNDSSELLLVQITSQDGVVVTKKVIF